MSSEHSLKQRLTSLQRESERSLTQQLVDCFAQAIERGELEPGAKLPSTRALAEMAGVNQLTASRAYRRLAQLGLVVAGVGRGTFVRETAALRRDGLASRGTAWQAYVLPAERETASGRMLGELIGQADREDLISLALGYPPAELIPLEQLEAATAAVLREQREASFHYSPVEGVGALRRELAALGQTRGLGDDADSILVTTGARQALALAARAVLRPGDVAACESPTFIGVVEALRATGAEVLPVPVDEGGLDLDALEQLLERHEIRMLALQSRLQNPTGHDLAPERRERLVALARRHSFFILEDGVYADLRLEGAAIEPLRALDPDHVIFVDSLSKTVSPGLRAGWVAASGPVLDRIVAEKRIDDAHSPTLTQQIVARFLSDGHYQAQLERARRIHRHRRDAMLAAIDTHLADAVTLSRPAGGANVWVTLNEPIDEHQLYSEAIRAGVSFTPGSAALVERPRATHMRLSFALLGEEQLEEGVRRLAAVIRSLHGARGRRSMPLI
jgi:2-aminoadipate transaminase